MLYILSKVLPLCFLPLGFSLLLNLFGLFKQKRYPFFISISFLWFFSLGIVSQLLWCYLESPLIRSTASQAQAADAIVVLSGGRHPAPGPARVSEWNDPDRFLAGLDLYRAGKAPLLLFTGGASPYRPGQPPEGQLYLQEAEQLGIPATAMASTPPVVNTAEEAVAISQLLHQSNGRNPRVLLVTSAFHMRRAQRLFERQGLAVVPFPVDFHTRAAWAGPLWRDPTQWFPSPQALNDSSRAIRELLGRLVYRAW